MATEFLDTVYRIFNEAKLKGSFLSVGSAADTLESKVQGLNGVLGALGLGAGVVGLNMVTSHLIETGAEAGNASEKLDAMLRTRGESGMRDDLDDLATRMAKLTGMDDDLFTEAESRMLSFGVTSKEIDQLMSGMTGQANTMGDGMAGVLANAEQVGKALSSINAGAITRSGTTLNPEDVKAINDLKTAGKFDEARALLFQKILESYGKYAAQAGEGIRSATREIGNFQTQVGNAEEAIGQGAEEMRARWMSSLTPMIESLNKNHEGLLKNVGGIVEMATQAGNIAAPIWGVYQAYRELKAMTDLAKIAQVAETGAEAAKIPVAQAEAAALGEVAIANNAAAASAGGLGITLGAVAAAALVAAGAYAVYKSATEWTPDAVTKSDDEMEKKGGMAKFTKDAANQSGWEWIGRVTTGTGANIEAGDEAERKMAEMKKQKEDSLLDRYRKGHLTNYQDIQKAEKLSREQSWGKETRDPNLGNPNFVHTPPAADNRGLPVRTKGKAVQRGRKIKIEFDDMEVDGGAGADYDDDLVSASYD